MIIEGLPLLRGTGGHVVGAVVEKNVRLNSEKKRQPAEVVEESRAASRVERPMPQSEVEAASKDNAGTRGDNLGCFVHHPLSLPLAPLALLPSVRTASDCPWLTHIACPTIPLHGKPCEAIRPSAARLVCRALATASLLLLHPSGFNHIVRGRRLTVRRYRSYPASIETLFTQESGARAMQTCLGCC